MVAGDGPLDLLGQDGGDAVAVIGGVRGEESLDGGELGITETLNQPVRRATSLSDSRSAAAATFSSRCISDEVPGIGSIIGER